MAGSRFGLRTTFRSRVRSLVLVNSIGGSSWRSGRGLRSIAERPLWDWGLHFPSDVWPIRQATRVLPVLAEDFVPNLVRNPRAIVKVANLARRADVRTELESLRDSGLSISIIWGTRDGIIPRESFEALCVASGVEGTVVEGSHSWLLADPQKFGEVITNDVRVAQAARDLEKQPGGQTQRPAPVVAGQARPEPPRPSAVGPEPRRPSAPPSVRVPRPVEWRLESGMRVRTGSRGRATELREFGAGDSYVAAASGDASGVEFGGQRDGVLAGVAQGLAELATS